MEVTSWTHADHTVNLSYFDADLEWGWPDVHHPAGMLWNEVKNSRVRWAFPSSPLHLRSNTGSRHTAQVGGNRPVSGSEIVDAPALVKVLSGKRSKGPGRLRKTISLNYETPSFPASRGWEVRLNNSDLNTTEFPRGVKRGDFIEVDGSYFTVVDPLPCAEYGAQSPASGSSYNQFEITKVDCETNLRTYPVDPDVFWTALWMTIHIQRKSTTTCRLACSNVLAVPQLRITAV